MRQCLCHLGMIVAFAAPISPVWAAQTSALCKDAARQAAEETGVPIKVLLAVALTETGRNQGQDGLQPWPWVSNQGGEAHWFDSQAEAVAYVESQIANGVSNIDLGCFQLNHRWHAQAFASTDAMFDPLSNARYAARLLADHYAKSGDWSLAAGAYHSGTPEFAERYRSKFDTHLAQLSGAPLADLSMSSDAAALLPDRPRENRFPLLLAGNRTRGPSLFPVLDPGQPLIGD